MSDEYNPLMHIRAGELRAMGFEVPEHIPDIAWANRTATHLECSTTVELGSDTINVELGYLPGGPFRWIEASFVFDTPKGEEGDQ